MRTSPISWPEDVLGCPLRASFRATVAPRFATATMNPPLVTYGPDSIEERRSHECRFVWRLDQLAAFEEFHDVTLARGMRWFMMRFPVAGIVKPQYSHIEGGYRMADTEGYVTVNFVAASFLRVGSDVA